MVLRPLINVSSTARVQGALVGILDDGPARREGRVGSRHFRERVRARARCVEDFSHALQPMFAGPYATGWRNVDEDQKIVPYHFTPDETGIPCPDLPASATPPSIRR
jgi:hypothetical protein